MSHARRLVAIGSIGLVMLNPLLAGCADQPASAAATVGEARIELQDITDQLGAINAILGFPPGSSDAQQTNIILRNNVVYELVEQGAADAGITVTQSQIDERLAGQIEFVGSENLLAHQAAAAGVAPDLIETDIRVALLAEEWAERLAPGEAYSAEAKQGRLVASVQEFSEDVGTTVNPRFGMWDVESLSIGADPDAPSAPVELGLLRQP